jgi:excisionase family DNA binding protein
MPHRQRINAMQVLENIKPTLISVEEACTKLRLSRSTLYALARRGEIEIKRLGPKISRVVVESLDRYVAGLPSFKPGSPIKTLTDEERAERDADLAKLGL